VTTEPPTIAVTPGVVSVATSVMSLKSSSVVAGSTDLITLQAVDAAGNDLTTGGSIVKFSLGGTGTAQGSISAVTDKGNGTYTATFTGTIAGANTITATIDGQTVATEPPTIVVTPGAATLATSSVTLFSANVASGSTDLITLQAEDSYGNDLTTGGLIVKFNLDNTGTGRGSIGAVTDNGDGTYTAAFTGTLVGTNSITATIGGQKVTSGSPTFTVIPGPASASTSTVKLSSGSIQSNGTATVTLQAKDLNGNDLTIDNLIVDFSLTNNFGAQGNFGPVTYAGNGVYTSIFTGVLAGKNTVTATVNGQTFDSTPTIIVTPGPVYPANSLVELGANAIQFGGTTTVTLLARDPDDNAETAGGLKVAFALGNKTGAKGTFSAVKDNRNGTYTAIFKGTLDGNNTIVATINGLPVASTAPISVEGKAFSTAESTVSVAQSTITAGLTTQVTLQAVYPKNVDEPAGGLTVTFKLGSTKGGQGTFSSVADLGNGTYTAIFTGTLAGTNTIKAYIDGQAVTSAAPAIQVVTGPLSLAKSPVTVSAASMTAGGTVAITLQPEDAGGNKLILGGSQTVVFALETGSGTFGPVVANPNGTYTATFTDTAAGSYTIATTINGLAVTSPAPTITVKPAAVSVTNSAVTVLPQNQVQSGGKVTVTLQARDNYGNPETAGNLAVAFKLGTGSGKGNFGKVTYAGNGIYQATFTGTMAGSNTISATIGAAKVTSTPAAITVTPGTYSLAESTATVSSSSVESGKSITVFLQTKDAAGNDLTTDLLLSGVSISFELANSTGGKGTFSSASYLGNGEYEATFTAATVGTNTIVAVIGSSKATSKAPSIAVTPV
jgi:adhesin/invasin